MANDTNNKLTQQAREGVRHVPWKTVLAGAGGVSVVTLLAVSGFGPLISAIAAKALDIEEVQDWLANLGANALSGWAADWATGATKEALAKPAERDRRAAELEQQAAADPSIAAALAKLLPAIDAVPQSLDALAGNVSAQSTLLTRLSADVQRVGLNTVELRHFVAGVTVAEADRVIAVTEARADKTDALVVQALEQLRRLQTAQRAVLDFTGAQVGEVKTGDIAGGDIYKPTIINQARPSREERLELRNRANLLAQVQRNWVVGVLHQSLHERVRIELAMQTRPDAVSHPWRSLVLLPDAAPRPLDPMQPLTQVFREAGGRLLIMGAPGGGKTTTLLTLAESLIEEALTDEDCPLPVVFQLSTWAVEQPPLHEWLVEEMAQRYKVPPKVGKAWVERGEVLPLLDGLDEVGPTDAERAACIEAINTYLAGQGGQVVVCSRTVEYEQPGARLKVETAIEVQPLTLVQVNAYLARLGPAVAGLRAAIVQEAVLRDLAASPLMLSVMALTYCDLAAEQVVGQSREETDRRIWTNYMARRLAQPRADALTNPAQLQAWLIWLSRGMIAHGQQVFYIEYLQMSWLATPGQRRVFRWMSSLGFGLTFGLATGLVFGLLGGMIGGLAFGLLFGLVYGLPWGRDRQIELTKTLSWDWRRLPDRLSLWGLVQRIMIIGLPIVLGFGLFGGVRGGIFGSMGGGVLGGVIDGLLGGMAIVLFFGLLTLLVVVLPPVMQEEILISAEPNDGVLRSRKNMLRFGLVSGLLGGLVGGAYGGLIVGLVFGLACWLLGSMAFGGDAIMQHYLLRRLLKHRCGAPWDFAATLNEAVSRTLMTRVGGGYRFHHRLLMEHFAQHEQSGLSVAPILGPQEVAYSGGRRARPDDQADDGKE